MEKLMVDFEPSSAQEGKLYSVTFTYVTLTSHSSMYEKPTSTGGKNRQEGLRFSLKGMQRFLKTNHENGVCNGFLMMFASSRQHL